jgi:hypothetical protein
MRRLALLLGVGLGLGCLDNTGPNEGLQSTVTLDRVRLVRGDLVHITVTVKGGKLSGSSSCLTGYSVLDASGTVVAPGDVVCTADLVTRNIPPDGYVRQFTWAGFTGGKTSGTPLAAGIYQIVGGAGIPGRITAGASAPVSLELVDGETN